MTATPEIKLPPASVTSTLGAVAGDVPTVADWPSPAFRASLLAGPMFTVTRPLLSESVPQTAWTEAVPTMCPLKTALWPLPAATRSPSTTPPVLPERLQVAATLPAKLL